MEGYDNLYKDPHTGVICNRNYSDRERYRIAKHHSLMNTQSQYDIKKLSEEVNELKSLLRQLLEK